MVYDEGQQYNPMHGSSSHTGLQQHISGSNAGIDSTYAYAAHSGNYSGSYNSRYVPIPKGDIMCSYCHKEGHIKEECYKLNGYPPGHPAVAKWNKGKNTGAGATQFSTSYKKNNNANYKYKTIFGGTTGTGVMQVTKIADEPGVSSDPIAKLQMQMGQLLSMFGKPQEHESLDNPEDHIMAGMVTSFASFTNTNINVWIVDTGATDHMTCNKNLFHTLNNLVAPVFVSLPNGNYIKVTQSGSIPLNSSISLHNVLYIPDFHCNLLAVSKLVLTDSLNIVFNSNSCVLQDQHQMQILATGELVNWSMVSTISIFYY